MVLRKLGEPLSGGSHARGSVQGAEDAVMFGSVELDKCLGIT